MIRISGFFSKSRLKMLSNLNVYCFPYFLAYWHLLQLLIHNGLKAFSSLLFSLLHQNHKCIKIHSGFSSFVGPLWRKLKFRSSCCLKHELFLLTSPLSFVAIFFFWQTAGPQAKRKSRQKIAVKQAFQQT